ncbi:MAG: cupin protein [Acidobacteria bacterium]|nr:cupin protein [Acidobacteriota bacterium]
MTHHRWTDVPREQITATVARRFITGDSVTIGRFELKQGGVVPSHAHLNEQISMVMSGVLLFRIDGRETIVKAGEVIQIPAGVPHAVEVIEDAVAIDVFSPVRQDWLDKTDTYFGR